MRLLYTALTPVVVLSVLRTGATPQDPSVNLQNEQEGTQRLQGNEVSLQPQPSGE